MDAEDVALIIEAMREKPRRIAQLLVQIKRRAELAEIEATIFRSALYERGLDPIAILEACRESRDSIHYPSIRDLIQRA